MKQTCFTLMKTLKTIEYHKISQTKLLINYVQYVQSNKNVKTMV